MPRDDYNKALGQLREGGADPAPPWPTVPQPATPDLDEAILAAALAVGKVAKDKQTTDGPRYDYTSVEEMVSHCRTALLEAGVLLRQTWKLARLAPHREDGGRPLQLYCLDVAFQLSAKGQSRTDLVHFPVVDQITTRDGTKTKPLDKAVATALSGSLTYYLRGLLLIPRGGDDMDGPEGSGQDHTQPPAQTGRPRGPAREPAQPKQPRKRTPEDDKHAGRLWDLCKVLAAGNQELETKLVAKALDWSGPQAPVPQKVSAAWAKRAIGQLCKSGVWGEKASEALLALDSERELPPDAGPQEANPDPDPGPPGQDTLDLDTEGA